MKNHNKQTRECYFPKPLPHWASAELNWCDDVYHVFVNSKTGCSGRLQMVATMTGSGFITSVLSSEQHTQEEVV